MKRRISILFSVIAIGALLLGACSPAEETPADAAEEEKIRVALVTASGGLGDRSFNDAAWAGFQRAEEEFDIETKVVEPGSVADYQTQLRSVASEGYDLVVGIGFDMKDAMSEVAPEFPDTYFGTVNVAIDSDNVATAQFKDHEGSFLAGALAGMMTETNVIGFVGGVDAANIRRFLVGYTEGAKYVNPDVEVLSSFVGSFADPAKGKEFAFEQFNQGADIVFQAAGKTGEGVIEAAAELDKYAIGVDQDQDYIAPGNVLTSMVKRVDVAMYDFIKNLVNGELETGVTVYGLAEGGVGLSEMEYTKDDIPQEYLDTIADLKENIISGEIVVTDAALVEE